MHLLGAYVKDNWTVGRRLTLNLGLCYAHKSVFILAGCREAAAPPSDVIFPADHSEHGPHRQLPPAEPQPVKVEKRFPLPRAHTARVTLNVYNALNANTATGLQNRSGPDFLRPRSIMPPRFAEVGVSYRF